MVPNGLLVTLCLKPSQSQSYNCKGACFLSFILKGTIIEFESRSGLFGSRFVQARIWLGEQIVKVSERLQVAHGLEVVLQSCSKYVRCPWIA